MLTLTTLLCTCTCLPQGDDPSQVGFDPLAIEWVLPGNFERARERARSERRLLLIKGVSFGIDEVGAVCASKGDW